MDLATAIHSVMMQFAEPGRTKYSVEPCQSGGLYSQFYKTEVCKESYNTGRSRYRGIAEVMVHAETRVANEGWTKAQLIAYTIAIGTAESGWREDVMVGRGQNGKPDDIGGEGRGPGMEACFMQIHPVSIPRFAISTNAGTAKPDMLLGSDQESISRCLQTGMRMIIHARRYCAWRAPQTDWRWAVAAMYATGNSCTSSNHGKTAVRYNYYKTVIGLLEQKLKE
jgi:hypothetical protein